jgi:hypothetical protein
LPANSSAASQETWFPELLLARRREGARLEFPSVSVEALREIRLAVQD